MSSYESRDFDIIGEAYHRWFEDNSENLGLHTADDYVQFVLEDIQKFAEIYIFIKNAEEKIIEGFECIFYNSARRYGLQSMLLLSPIKTSDSAVDWKKKITLVSRFIDLILTTRSIAGEENSYDRLRYPSFDITNEIRDKNINELLDYLRGKWTNFFSFFDKVPTITYGNYDLADIRYILARIASFLEDEFSLDTKVGFYGYWQRGKSTRTFDIEHLLKENCDDLVFPGSHGFLDQEDYSRSRNLLGALTLLPRSRNRALQDKSYNDKLSAYATENVLNQTLTSGFYVSNPTVNNYLSTYPDLAFSSISDFNKMSIEVRGRSYMEVAKRVWRTP